MANIYHRVIVACRSQLVSELQKGDLNSLADGLYENGILAPPELGDIQSGKEQIEKARRLTDALENRVKCYQRSYQLFIEMLTLRSSQFHGLTVILDNKMSELKLELKLQEGESRSTSARSTRTYYSPRNSRRLSELDDSYIYVECPCRKCATNDFVNGKNCPNAPPKSCPFLRMCSQKDQADTNEIKFADYKQSIMEQTHDINSKHKALLLHTTQQLKEKVPLDVVKETVRSLLSPPHVNESLYTCIYERGVKGRLRDVGTHDDLRSYLENNFCCWFNIQLIADLRKALLLKGKRDDSYICDYKEHLAQYLKRSCVKHTICDTENGKEYMEIVCLVSTDFRKITTEQIRIFEYTLRQYVCMPDCSKTVDEQSGELIFTEKEPTTNQQVIIHQDLGATESIDNTSTDSILQNVHGLMEIRTFEKEDSCCSTKKLCLCIAIIIPCLIPCIVLYYCNPENNRDAENHIV